MGLGIVLLFWAVVAAVVAGIASAVFGGVTFFLKRKVNDHGSHLVRHAMLFPFVCLAWAGIVFVIYAIINAGVFHRDPGIGDGFDCPLPNGYALSMIDVTDFGRVYNPETLPGGGGSTQGHTDAVDDVRQLQVAGRYILGGSESHALEHYGNENVHIDSYFILDAQSGQQTKLDSYELLAQAATNLGVKLDLEPIERVYRKYRFTWFDYSAIALMLIPPGLAFAFLSRRILRL